MKKYDVITKHFSQEVEAENIFEAGKQLILKQPNEILSVIDLDSVKPSIESEKHKQIRLFFAWLKKKEYFINDGEGHGLAHESLIEEYFGETDKQ